MRSSGIAPGPAAATLLAVALCGAIGCAEPGSAADEGSASHERTLESLEVIEGPDTTGLARAIFAGGCFWCVETAFEDVPGVRASISGYAGGEERNPTYEQVASGRTGHAEAVLVSFDPDSVSYASLLEIFWVNHDPTVNDRQFCDHGRQYRPAIFPLDEPQRRAAEESVEWAKSHLRVEQPILTEITPVERFWPAEAYHQDFYLKSPTRYRSYRTGCGRDPRLRELWGDLAGTDGPGATPHE